MVNRKAAGYEGSYEHITDEVYEAGRDVEKLVARLEGALAMNHGHLDSNVAGAVKILRDYLVNNEWSQTLRAATHETPSIRPGRRS